MTSSFALRKLLFEHADDGQLASSGCHFSCSKEVAMRGMLFERPVFVSPRCGYRGSVTCLVACLAACIVMKRRQHENMWVALFSSTVLYFLACKYHQMNNGATGHHAGFFAASLLALCTGTRLVTRHGKTRWNLCLCGCSWALAWYELGRFHIWVEHGAAANNRRMPERSFDLLGEYVPHGVDVELLPYRPLTQSSS